jgi:hypothetical protein
MASLIALAQSVGLAYASGVSVHATILLVGLMMRAHWISPMSGPWAVASRPIVLMIAGLARRPVDHRRGGDSRRRRRIGDPRDQAGTSGRGRYFA